MPLPPDRPASPQLGYYLGCPVWASPEWGGVIYPPSAKRGTWLSWYSKAFNSVEGNSAFYSLPSRELIARWCDETAEGFQFCFKVPREISHDARLENCEQATMALLDRLQLLQERHRLGPTFLQLPPTFSFAEFDALVDFIDRWPEEFPLAVEVRHADYFDAGRREAILDELLRGRDIDRCLFDTRCLFSAPPTTTTELTSQQRKPKSPHRTTVTGSRPMLRIVGRDRPEEADPWLAEWTPIIAQWLDEGLTPYIFMHAPNDAFAPPLAWRFHEMLRALRPKTPELPPPDLAPPEPPSRQQMLF